MKKKSIYDIVSESSIHYEVSVVQWTKALGLVSWLWVYVGSSLPPASNFYFFTCFNLNDLINFDDLKVSEFYMYIWDRDDYSTLW